jgi:hypothetical protein
MVALLLGKGHRKCAIVVRASFLKDVQGANAQWMEARTGSNVFVLVLAG